VAVAVEHDPHLVLDEEYRIVEVGPAAQAEYGSLRGQRLWEVFPGSRPLFEPYYEKARTTGQPVEFVQFYNGRVSRLRAVAHGPMLHVNWEKIYRLHTLTLEGLRTSLDQTIAAIEEWATMSERTTVRESLTVLEGGANAAVAGAEVIP